MEFSHCQWGPWHKTECLIPLKKALLLRRAFMCGSVCVCVCVCLDRFFGRH